MTWESLNTLLNQLFTELNQQNSVQSPQEIWDNYSADIQQILSEHPDEFVNLSPNLSLPKAIETARMLSQIKQRFQADKDGRNLIGRIRAEVLLRQRPIRNINVNTLTGETRSIANVAANLPKPINNFSQFQIDGWSQTLQAIHHKKGLVIVAPTGSGKTEVFLLPLIYEIARQIQLNPEIAPRFILLYPRVALLKDQLSRIFRYVYQAEQNQLASGQLELLSRSKKANQRIIIGFQFSGIASETKYTLENQQIFADKTRFKVLQDECCPVCNQGDLIYQKKRNSVPSLQCNNDLCGAIFNVSLAKNDHAKYQPHLLVTTAESLDRIYLNPKPDFEKYLTRLSGVLFDEVHLYHSLYGAHIHHLIQRLENLSGNPLTKIAASATVAHPERFASKFFYGEENHPILIHSASGYESEASGLEVLYFLQSPEEANRVGAAPTLIQSAMAMGHGLFVDRPHDQGDRGIIFTESLDIANRLSAQIQDAEQRLNLWQFRSILDNIEFQEQSCPQTNPLNCFSHYLEGECWRGILGGANCTQPIPGFRENALNISYVSSQQKTSYWEGDIVVATPSLDVGVDDNRIIATFHYRPPRNVFSFIQRRGRAGRAANTVAYTLLIVANSASDHFYFFRRHRLVHGSYELPLNPKNPVLKAMHERIAYERARMGYHVQRCGKIPPAILDWIWEKLEESPIIKQHYHQWLQEHRQDSKREEKLRKWITEQKERFEAYLNLRWTLQEIENEAPDTLTEPVKETFKLIQQYLDGQTNINSESQSLTNSTNINSESQSLTNSTNINSEHQSLTNSTNLREEINRKLRNIYQELGLLVFDEEDRESREELSRLQRDILELWNQLQEKVEFGICFEQADGLYNFFHTLERFREPKNRLWILKSAPDVIKTVLQALFYLRLSDNLHQSNNLYESNNLHQSNIDFFIPDAYFNEVKPIIVAVRTRNRTNLKQEDTTKLSTLLIPYRTAYRYHSHPYLSVIETEHDPQWANVQWGEGGVVGVKLLGEGVHLTGESSEFRPEKLYVKALKGDNQGKQVVKICPECCTIYSESRRRRCHDVPLRAVRLYAEANLERTYRYKPESVQTISRTLNWVSELESQITVHGSIARVENKFYDQQKNEYFTPRGSQPWQFEARYVDSQGHPEPVRYGLKTTGITWNLAEIIDNLLQDESLKSQIERVEIEETHKTFDQRLILHTASHLLQKAIASISGVSEEVLEYCFDETTAEVIVWERYEGGSGISEVFIDTLRTNPKEVYRELLASVLCPVNLAERRDWSTPDELRNELITTWNLHDDASGSFIDLIVREASAERNTANLAQNSPTEDSEEVQITLQCQRLDGCPACLHTNNCTERFEQPLVVSHLVAEALMSGLGHLL
ncbi:DEAD/DEAH box helicase [Crocosphaera sp. XPORK-15E]|uniref:DEAD/DEAH box helicase n=1 Tax=Crocosphaera sp. XPORK-15E TaxID=3110247 RepID=UPI002B214261|nr:DEAD/DEAH box helicase [Crocosphaera sp. XPORK-15E]MEA5536686.1 DEAD/DEAH box helicase [Crocosphaera sp. XPORK-15E]